MNASHDWLPPLVLLGECDRNWDRYIEVVFGWFHKDFVASRPSFENRRVAHKKDPMQRGKEAAFWHLVSEGDVEELRTLDLRRCERIRWPRPMIEAVANGGRVKCWKNTRGKDQRAVIALEDFSYVVVLADRGKYVLLWTAYCVEKNHRRRKLEKEFKAYAKSHNG